MLLFKRLSLGFVPLLLIFIADQWSKEAVLTHLRLMREGDYIPAIEVTSFFNLTLVWNSGISFGMLAAQNQPHILAFLSMVVSIFLLVWLARSPSKMVGMALGCIVGGALGNALDRLRYGAVVDFLDFHAFGFHWPAFNIADSAIFIGVVLLCIHSMFIETRSPASS